MALFGNGTSSSRRNIVAGDLRCPTDGLHYTHSRVLSVERLDSADAAEAEENLRELARINSWFGGHRTLLGLLETLVKPEDRFSILDVGAGSGDMARCIQNRFRFARVVSLDRRLLHLKTAPSSRVAADAEALPFADGSFDLVMCSSLLHHFSNDEGITLLRGMQRVARRALIVLDIERHVLAYHFLPVTRAFFRWSNLTVLDGCASVEAAFRYTELEALAKSLAPENVVVRRHRPWFRISLVVAKGDRS